MANLLSVHISSGRRDTFGLWLDTLHQSGNPPPVIYSVNENIDADLVQFSPETRWVYRFQSEVFNRLPSGMFTGDPRANARYWMTGLTQNGRNLMQQWALNPADWHDGLNEPSPGTPTEAP